MLLMTLLLIFLTNGMSILINEECLSNNIKEYEIRKEDVVPITTYLTDEYNILFQISFEDRMEGLDMDYIKVKPNSYEITRKRNGVPSKDILNTSIPFGWVNMNITASKHVFYINPYIGNISSEYPIQHLSIASQYLSSCEQGTPSWNIVRNKTISMPLNNNGRSQISLTSVKDFSPFFTIIGSKYYLTDEYGISLGSSGMKLLANTYTFIVEIENNNFRLSYKKEECDLEVLVFLKLKTKLWNITVGTLDEDFTLVLEPMIHHSSICEITSEIYEPTQQALLGNTQTRTNVGLVITAVIFGVLFIITATVLIVVYGKTTKHTTYFSNQLRKNNKKFAPLFNLLGIQRDQHMDQENVNKGGLQELQPLYKERVENDDLQKQQQNVKDAVNDKQREIDKLHQANESLQLQLNAKNEETYNLKESKETETKALKKQLCDGKKEIDQVNKSLQSKIAALQEQVTKGYTYRNLHIIRNKEDPNGNIPLHSIESDEFNGEMHAKGWGILDVLLTIMVKYPGDTLVQSTGIKILTNMKKYFLTIDKASKHPLWLEQTVLRSFEGDSLNTSDTINCALILRENGFIEKFCDRAVHSAIRHISHTKDPTVICECLQLLQHNFHKENTKQKEDMIDECIGTVLNVFEDLQCTEVNINTSLFFNAVINIENEKIRSRAYVVRMANAAAVHIENNENPEVVSNCLTMLHHLFSNANTNQKENMVNSHLTKGVLTYLKTNLQSYKAEDIHEVDDNYKTGWEILNMAVYQSKINCDKFVLTEVFDLVLQYLKKFKAGAKATPVVLSTSISIILFPQFSKHFIKEGFLKIIYGFLEDDTKFIWERTIAADLVCILARDGTGAMSVMNTFSSKVFFKKLIECIENKRLQLYDRVDKEVVSKWKQVKDKPQPHHFEEIRKFLISERVEIK